MGASSSCTTRPLCRGAAGLNSGLTNSCYANAAIQCLSHTSTLTRDLLSLSLSAPLSAWGAAAQYVSVLEQLWSGEVGCVASDSLRALIKSADLGSGSGGSVRFASLAADSGQQRDAFDFLLWLLDELHK
jgi:ubiquitin C-terminal hydrolase